MLGSSNTKFRQCTHEKGVMARIIREGLYSSGFMVPWIDDGHPCSDFNKLPVVKFDKTTTITGFAASGTNVTIQVLNRIKCKTTQGSLFICVATVIDTQTIVVLKLDRVKHKQATYWPGILGKKMFATYPDGTYSKVSAAYMDAWANMKLSRAAECHKSPHFPLCYGSGITMLSIKNNTVPYVAIFMEYLPIDTAFVETLRDYNGWASMLWQSAAGLNHLQAEGITHNDYHGGNCMCYRVSSDTILTYSSNNGYHIDVPTYGKVFTILDFGRCTTSCEDGIGNLVSLEVPSECIPYNKCADWVRFTLSVCCVIETMSDTNERDYLSSFFEECCHLESGDNLMTMLNNAEYIGDHLQAARCQESIPKQKCHKTTTQFVLSKLLRYFTVTKKICDGDKCGCFRLNFEVTPII